MLKKCVCLYVCGAGDFTRVLVTGGPYKAVKSVCVCARVGVDVCARIYLPFAISPL